MNLLGRFLVSSLFVSEVTLPYLRTVGLWSTFNLRSTVSEVTAAAGNAAGRPDLLPLTNLALPHIGDAQPLKTYSFLVTTNEISHFTHFQS